MFTAWMHAFILAEPRGVYMDLGTFNADLDSSASHVHWMQCTEWCDTVLRPFGFGLNPTHEYFYMHIFVCRNTYIFVCIDFYINVWHKNLIFAQNKTKNCTKKLFLYFNFWCFLALNAEKIIENRRKSQKIIENHIEGCLL